MCFITGHLSHSSSFPSPCYQKYPWRGISSISKARSSRFCSYRWMVFGSQFKFIIICKWNTWRMQVRGYYLHRHQLGQPIAIFFGLRMYLDLLFLYPSLFLQVTLEWIITILLLQISGMEQTSLLFQQASKVIKDMVMLTICFKLTGFYLDK